MGRHTKEKAKITTISGVVESVAEDRKSFVIKTDYFDPKSKKYVKTNDTIYAQEGQTFPDDIQPNYPATAVTYELPEVSPTGVVSSKYISINAASRNNYFEVNTPDPANSVAVISGMLYSARYKIVEGVNASGKPKSNDYQLQVFVGDEFHLVHIYDSEKTHDKLESLRRKIEGEYFINPDTKPEADENGKLPYGFVDGQTTPTYITIVTNPPQEYRRSDGTVSNNRWTQINEADGTEKRYVGHSFYSSVDVELCYPHRALPKNKTQNAAKTAPVQQAPVQTQPVPVVQTQAAPVQTAPAPVAPVAPPVVNAAPVAPAVPIPTAPIAPTVPAQTNAPVAPTVPAPVPAQAPTAPAQVVGGSNTPIVPNDTPFDTTAGPGFVQDDIFDGFDDDDV